MYNLKKQTLWQQEKMELSLMAQEMTKIIMPKSQSLI